MPSSHSKTSSSKESRHSGSSTYYYDYDDSSEYMDSTESQAEQSTQGQTTPRPSFPTHSNDQQRDGYYHTVRPRDPWNEYLHTVRDPADLVGRAANNIRHFDDDWERATHGNNSSGSQISREPGEHDYRNYREPAWRRDDEFVYHGQYGISLEAVHGSAASASGGSSSESHHSSHHNSESSGRDHNNSRSSGNKKSKHDNTKDSRRRHH